MAFGADMGEEVRNVGKVRLLGADAADEHCRIHNAVVPK